MSNVMRKSSLNQDQGPHLLQSEALRCLVSQRNAPLYHSIAHSRKSNLFFAELKNQWCLAGTQCFGRGPKAQIIAMDWKVLHPQVSNLHSSRAIYETKQLPPTTLWRLKLPVSCHCQGVNTHRHHHNPVSWTISVEEPRTEVVHKSCSCGDSFSVSPFTYSRFLTFILSFSDVPGTCCPSFPLKQRFCNSATQIKYLEHACFNPDLFMKTSRFCHLDRAICYLNQQNFGIA